MIIIAAVVCKDTELNMELNAIVKISKPGPGCSKLTTSLVNVSLKFPTLISQTRQHFSLKKCEKLLSFFFNKNISIFGYKVVKHLTS